MKKEETSRAILVNPGTEVVNKTQRQIGTNVGIRITKDMAKYIKELANKNYTTTQIRGMVRERFKTQTPPSDTTVYLIKTGKYPPLLLKKETPSVKQGVGAAVEKQTELTVNQLLCRPTNTQADKRVSAHPKTQKGISISPVTIIEENPGVEKYNQGRGKSKMRITSSPEWKACFNQVRDSVPGSQVLKATWDLYNSQYRSGTGRGVGHQVGGLKADLRSAAMASGMVDELRRAGQAFGKAIKDSYKSAYTPERRQTLKGAAKGAWAKENMAPIRDELRAIGGSVRDVVKANADTYKRLGENLSANAKAQWDALSGIKAELSSALTGRVAPLWTPEARGLASGAMRGAFATLGSQVEGVGQLALTARKPVFGQLLLEIGGMGGGGFVGLFLTRGLDKAFANAMPRTSGLVAAGIVYTGVYALHSYLEQTGQISMTEASFGGELLNAVRMASIIYLLSKVTIGGQKLITVTDEVGTYIPQASAYIAPTLTEDQKEEVLAQVEAKMGFRPPYVDVQVTDDGQVIALVPQEGGIAGQASMEEMAMGV